MRTHCAGGQKTVRLGRSQPGVNLVQRNIRASRSVAPRSTTVAAAVAQPVAAPTTVLSNFVQDRQAYDSLYKLSVEDPQAFWGSVAEGFTWNKKWAADHHHANFDVSKGPIVNEWFKGATTNICYNALDRHVEAGHGAQACLLFEGNDPGQDKSLSYQDVLSEVSRLANWLKTAGVQKGDAVAMYMPQVCELPMAMLACARIGAIHTVVFGGFSAEALAGRMADCKAKVLITCSGVMRGAKPIELKKIADKALTLCEEQGHKVPTVLVYEHEKAVPAAITPFVEGRDVWWKDALVTQKATCPVEWVDSEHPLFLLYTSGSTGKPKGVVHSTGGYMVYAATTTRHVFKMEPGDVFFCTADCGWITGHSYLAYGPLLNRATNVVFEGVPTHPTPARFWEIIDKLQVKQFYTAPTAIRSLMGKGDSWVKGTSRSSLKILGSVGEPINPEAWRWYHEVVGDSRCPIVDTWWQTETGGHMITPLPSAGGPGIAWEEKPGSATLPFFGVQPVIVDEKGNELNGEAEGLLLIKSAWPSALRTVYGDHARFEENYFKPFPGYYFTGDGARRDADGYYWITGRVDDVINVSGHRIGTAEVESALVAHPACSEAAVVGYDHPIKGQGIYAYVTLMDGLETSEKLRKELTGAVRNSIGAFAAPDVIHWAPGLPKTRSGKIMRRVLRKIASQEHDTLGDISTLADTSVVVTLVELWGK
mmetsp:Transcript_19106/g.32798  ORF Transcript_19106/g.32798 Transcript_19106/m.32798 type:complete len:706 (+) Transcript_19106:76-2193(+)|eukprot:CAMPEP_0119110306 /NCGR_PEP_ID=MMETSP1180-20130426/28635_1 /TAXON_ID=3052 ORGANISM="Chlamydomonas cf sp, Strain CCMP681" /NCGR_SAMPLE_ID=MMETSP1180 /ASSEMBLY_ACC=CAM_ASM_000741 /LENGTH=705 /DNA_ID=CAMNT_0007096563 /DNA_START=32 /DNA_END=2149 /DNA_ORIENTATION=-